jgi:putative transposase
MSQSLSKLYIHIVFHIKNHSCVIRDNDKAALFAYIGSIIKDNESSPIIINGTGNHVHIFCIMSKNISLSKFVEEIKRHSSRWLKVFNVYYKTFAWQGGYGGFSVSPSLFNKTKQYISNQECHHQKLTIADEYLLFLKEYEIEFNEKYLWAE